MNLYVVRHGQTQYNLENRVCGITDIELTDLGRQQAHECGEHLANQKIDMILVSPLIRAQETASIINQYVNCPIIVQKDLHEINFGQYEGVKRNHRGFRHVKKNHGIHYPKGESYFEVIQRVYNLIDDIIEKYPDMNILLVCHGGIVRTIETYFTDHSNKEIFHYSVDNCHINHYEI